jgi:hypothetical protein
VSHRAKKLLGTYVPERWMVEVTYRNGEAPSMFTNGARSGLALDRAERRTPRRSTELRARRAEIYRGQPKDDENFGCGWLGPRPKKSWG